jgi:hypothetical protein
LALGVAGAHIAVAVRQNGAALRLVVTAALNASIKLKKTILID